MIASNKHNRRPRQPAASPGRRGLRYAPAPAPVSLSLRSTESWHRATKKDTRKLLDRMKKYSTLWQPIKKVPHNERNFLGRERKSRATRTYKKESSTPQPRNRHQAPEATENKSPMSPNHRSTKTPVNLRVFCAFGIDELDLLAQ